MSIYKKLLEAKKEIGKISKDSTNPFFKSKYFDINQLLEHVEPILQKNGLLLIQPIADGSVSSVICDVDSENEDVLVSSIPLPELNDPQKIGSAITYYRRYTLQSLLGLQAEDDDANLASNKKPKAGVNGYPEKGENEEPEKEWLNVGDRAWNKAVAKKLPLTEVRNHYKVSRANAEEYEKAIA